MLDATTKPFRVLSPKKKLFFIPYVFFLFAVQPSTASTSLVRTAAARSLRRMEASSASPTRTMRPGRGTPADVEAMLRRASGGAREQLHRRREDTPKADREKIGV